MTHPVVSSVLAAAAYHELSVAPKTTNSWVWSTSRRRVDWPAVPDEVFAARFEALSRRFHPVVAAILAHDPVNNHQPVVEALRLVEVETSL